MRKLTQIATVIVVCALVAAPAFSDTLVLKSGEKISGLFEGGTARQVKFRTSDGVLRDYDILSIQQVQFGDEKAVTSSTSSTSSASSSASSANNGPRLLSNSERAAATQPASSNAANSAWTIPTGSTIVIRMIDGVNSERNKIGDQFVATLEEPVVVNGVEVIAKGVDVRGRIANINEAGRIAGSAQLGLELTQVYVNGIPYSVTTSEYQEVAEGRGGQTAKRVGAGAGIGAVIGAIAGGGKGAAIGAGVGGGGATAVQVLTKGEKLNIPSETKLEFTLRAPLVIAGSGR